MGFEQVFSMSVLVRTIFIQLLTNLFFHMTHDAMIACSTKQAKRQIVWNKHLRKPSTRRYLPVHKFPQAVNDSTHTRMLPPAMTRPAACIMLTSWLKRLPKTPFLPNPPDSAAAAMTSLFIAEVFQAAIESSWSNASRRRLASRYPLM